MDKGKGQGSGKVGSGQGQSKPHTIRNTQTGEADRQIDQTEWRTQGKALRDAGWQRVDDESGEIVDEGGELPEGVDPSVTE